MKKSFLMAIPVLALLMGSAHPALDLDNLPGLPAEDRAYLAQAEDQSEYNRAEIYITYLKRADAGPAVIERILEDAESHHNPCYTANVYIAYINSKSPDTVAINRIFEGVQGIHDECIKSMVYVVFLGCEVADAVTAKRILDKAHNFEDEFYKARIYRAYLKNTLIHDAETPARIKAELAIFSNARQILDEIERECQEKKNAL